VGAARRPRVLCVDDEEHVLESLRDTLRRRFDVLTTTNGFEALRLLGAHPCEVLLSDMRMPMLHGARFLTLARQHAPETVRVMLTGHSTLDDAALAVNEGDVFRLLIKPCSPKDLTAVLEAAVEQHERLAGEQERHDEQLRSTLRSLLELTAAFDPAGTERAARLRREAVELARRAGGTEAKWALERACELLQLGAASLPAETRARLAQGTRLSRQQAAELERLPQLALPFLQGIAPLQPIAEVLAQSDPATAREGSADGAPARAGRILRVVLDFDAHERQGLSADAALQALRRGAARYDVEVLDAFAAQMEAA
jgi:response regulator RpfG family c-di-GMP phosphodiesterase